MKKLNKQAREQANDVSDPTTNANLYIDEYLYDTHTHIQAEYTTKMPQCAL